MSVVYAAEHQRLGRKVALKLLAGELVRDRAYRERFVRESRLAASLHHPNIVPIHDAGEADDTPYITMYLVQGEDLAETIRREGPLEPDRLLPILEQAAAALDAAHSRDLVHRDVKPANILIASGEGAEEPGHVYLTDFGLAKNLGEGPSLTRAGLFMGTLDYMAPEQIQGHRVDRRVDVYALGCVIYESLTGAPPFRRDTDVAMMYAHIQESPPRVTERRPDLSAAVDEVVARAMAKEPEERFPTTADLVVALRNALASPPMEKEEASMQAEPNLEGAVAVDHRGQRYALGRTSDAYAVWALSGGPAVRTFPQEDRHWEAAWQAFQDLESGREAETPTAASPAAQAAPPVVAPAAGKPEGAVVMDYQGSRYGVGRTRDAYAIWDLSRGGPAFETHPLSEDGWQVVWHRYQQLEAGAPAAEPATPSPAAGPAETPGAAPPAEEPTREVEPVPAATPAEERTREAEPASTAEAGPELEGAAAIDYRGGAYALGRTAGGYGIWDATTGGRPILTFPATPEAWNQAWDAYQRLERAGGG
jgi:Protein kinase domain